MRLVFTRHGLKRIALSGAAILSISASAAGQPDSQGIHLAFSNRGAVISGITPRGNVVVYSIARRQVQFQHGRSFVWRFAKTAGADGTVDLQTPSDIEPDRLWVVVDEKSARHTIVRTSGSVPVRRLPMGWVTHENDDRGGRLTIPLQVSELMLVRPGEGAWVTTAGDGGTGDDDGTLNLRAVVRPDKLRDVHGKDRKANKFDKGDLIIVIEPVTQSVYEARLK